MNRALSLIAAIVAVSSCNFSGQMKGTRPVTAADRAAVEQARFECYAPLKVPSSNGNKIMNPIVLAQAVEGPVLLDGEWVTTNHWQSPLGDHFLGWNGGMGEETIVAPDRRSALRFIYSNDAHVDSFDVSLSADGTTRPAGIPMSVQTCLPSAEVAQRLAKGLPALPERGVREVSSDVPRELFTFRLGGCRTNGGKVKPSGILPDWLWLPWSTSRDVDGKTYVAFNNSVNGTRLLFEVTPEANGDFEFAIGAVTYVGKYIRVDAQKERMNVVGSIQNRQPAEIGCNYFYPKVMTNIDW